MTFSVTINVSPGAGMPCVLACIFGCFYTMTCYTPDAEAVMKKQMGDVDKALEGMGDLPAQDMER